MEKNNPNAKYFDFGEYTHLYQRIAADTGEFAKEDADNVQEAVNSCLQYVNFVDIGENRIKRTQVALECGDIDIAEFQETLQSYDSGRRAKHQDAIASVNMLNRISALYGCGKVYTGSEDRLEIADFCLEVTIELFRNRNK